MSGPKYIADFDSSAAFLKSTAAFLHGGDFPALGQNPVLGRLAPLVNLFPRSGREFLYTIGGALETTKPSEVEEISSEELAEWVTSLYPQRPYPAIVIGSSSGALPHLCAALGIPWLPQTFLVPVRHSGVSPDDPKRSMEAGHNAVRTLLKNNPDLQLHHMHDPVQDRLMLHKMLYFRIKWRGLPKAYRNFIAENLQPGGAVIISECDRSWPVTKVADRHYFQFGALGGATEEEFFEGSDRVTDYFKRYKVPLRKWDPPEPDLRRPEAEWGFEPDLRDQLKMLSEGLGCKLVQMKFNEPEDLSPLIADLYRWWYRNRGMPASRLLVESFIIHEPNWAMRTGSVPFWMKFNSEFSASHLESYLNSRDQFDEINLMLFNHGTEGPGLAPIKRWKELLAHAGKKGRFLGLSENKYPLDFGSFGSYYHAIKKIPSRYPLPASLTLGDLVSFGSNHHGDYKVEFTENR